jgi:hypothetical protein
MADFTGFVNAAAQLGIESVFIKPARKLFNVTQPDGTSLDDIIAQAVIEERHSDELEITSHPVEQGASIADHAFKHPAEVILTMGWSNSPSQSGGIVNSLLNSGVAYGAATSSAVRQVANAVGLVQAGLSTYQSAINGTSPDQISAIYARLIALQESRAMFSIYTGKRKYDNMVCKSLITETTYKTAEALIVTMICQQIIVVNTKLRTFSKENMLAPQNNMDILNMGQQNLPPGLLSPGATPLSFVNIKFP